MSALPSLAPPSCSPPPGDPAPAASPAAAALPPALAFQRVTKWFDSSDDQPLTVLQDVSVEVPAGRTLAIVGASGCGKSTLLNIASGLLQPDRGRLLVDGVPARDFADWRSLSYMFQEDRLLPWRTAVDNLAFGLEGLPMPAAERRRLASETLALVGLEGFAKAFPHQLSGGMRSRVALGRSLVGDPRILLMDEPFSKLDPSIRAQMHEEVLRIQRIRRMTIVLVTHDVEEAVSMADKVVVLLPRPGRVREVVDIDLPRPRVATDRDFIEQVRAIRVLI